MESNGKIKAPKSVFLAFPAQKKKNPGSLVNAILMKPTISFVKKPIGLSCDRKTEGWSKTHSI